MKQSVEKLLPAADLPHFSYTSAVGAHYACQLPAYQLHAYQLQAKRLMLTLWCPLRACRTPLKAGRQRFFQLCSCRGRMPMICCPKNPLRDCMEKDRMSASRLADRSCESRLAALSTILILMRHFDFGVMAMQDLTGPCDVQRGWTAAGQSRCRRFGCRGCSQAPSCPDGSESSWHVSAQGPCMACPEILFRLNIK